RRQDGGDGAAGPPAKTRGGGERRAGGGGGGGLTTPKKPAGDERRSREQPVIPRHAVAARLRPRLDEQENARHRQREKKPEILLVEKRPGQIMLHTEAPERAQYRDAAEKKTRKRAGKAG